MHLGALPEVVQRHGVQAHDVDDLELRHVARDLLQSAAVAEAHEPHQRVPEGHDLLRLAGPGADREGHLRNLVYAKARGRKP